MNKILKKILKKEMNSTINHVQAKIGFGLPMNSPKELSLDELRMWTRGFFDAQKQVYNTLEELKW